MNCPRCDSDMVVKSGKARGKQRYKCFICNYNFTVKEKSTNIDKEIKKLALILFLEGYSYHYIGDFFAVSHVSVMNWIKKLGEPINEFKSENKRKKRDLPIQFESLRYEADYIETFTIVKYKDKYAFNTKEN